MPLPIEADVEYDLFPRQLRRPGPGIVIGLLLHEAGDDVEPRGISELSSDFPLRQRRRVS